MQRSFVLRGLVLMLLACGVAAPARAQADVERSTAFVPAIDFSHVIPQPAGPPPTPRHTGIKAKV